MGAAIWGLIRETSFTNFAINQLLDEVALIVFGIAVMDVVKYLMTEEVLKSESERDTHQTSRSLTKFVIIIATALSLEGLVLTIEVVKTDLRLVIYPAVLFFIATIFIIGLGVYVRVRRND
ncbi:MAG: hypothetical protein S4CHLAM102_12740 [Chlamydiia bacterium]|nr:hypothetical protein [Chlamydiia bacterium]